MKLPLAAAALFASLACLHCVAPNDDDPARGTSAEALTTTGGSTDTTTTTTTTDGTKKDAGSTTSGPFLKVTITDVVVSD